MISKVTLFFFCLLISFSCLLGIPRLALADSLEELKNALQGNDVEAAWQAVDKMPQKISPRQREKTAEVLTTALQKEWARCVGDIRQSIAVQLAALNAKEAVPNLLGLIKEKKNIDHECAE